MELMGIGDRLVVVQGGVCEVGEMDKVGQR